jgi:hypothetical protein
MANNSDQHNQSTQKISVKIPHKNWIYILLAGIIILGSGGCIAYQQIFPKNSQLPAVMLIEAATQTVTTPIQGYSAIIQTSDTSQSNAAQTPAALKTVEPGEEPNQPLTIQPTSAMSPAGTPTPTEVPVVIGGADKIAYINEGNVWVANLDGSDLTQLTYTDELKSYLRWLPDGQGLTYISGKCIHTVSLQAEDDIITCFNNATYLGSFEVSPDGKQVAISLDNQLYLLPFDLLQLREAHHHKDLASMATCANLAPYRRNYGRSVRWSKDSKVWAAEVLGVLEDGRRGEMIQVFDVDSCLPNPPVKILFPEPHFTYKGYQTNPTIENFAWNGTSLFAFNDSKRNDGFGDLHIFNMDEYKPMLSINPIRKICCYRDAQWSPDGSYLVFAFQDYLQGSNSTTQLYMIPFSEIGTDTPHDPLPLPVIVNPREKPQPVLRPTLNP